MFTLAQWIARLTKGYIKYTGKKPDGLAKLKIKMEAAQKVKNQKSDPSRFLGWKPKVIKGGKKEGIEKVIPQEVIPKETPMTEDKFFRIKQGLSTKIKLNTLGENKQLAKTFIGGKHAEFNSLDRTAQKEILDRLTINIRNAQAEFATPVKPDDLASGGIAGQLHLYDGGRASFVGGGAAGKLFMEFVEKLFIKPSNDIRLGKGLFKGLDQKQRIIQHDNLTKMVTQWQKTKKLPEGSEQYFGIDAEKAFAAAQTKVKKVDLSKTKKVDKNIKLTEEEWKDFVEIF